MNSCVPSKTSHRILTSGNKSRRKLSTLLIHQMKNNSTNNLKRQPKKLPINRPFITKTSTMNASNASDLTSRWKKTRRELTMQMAGFGNELSPRKRCLKSQMMNGRRFTAAKRYLLWTNLQMKASNTHMCKKSCAASHQLLANSCQWASIIKCQRLIVLLLAKVIKFHKLFLCLLIYLCRNLKYKRNMRASGNS